QVTSDCPTTVKGLDPAGACKVTVAFAPTQPGPEILSVTVSATPGGAILLTARGTSPPLGILNVTPNPHATVTSDPAGIDCGDSCSHGFSSGFDVVLTATADPLFVLGPWSGTCAGVGDCVPGAATCTVTMAAATCTVAVATTVVGSASLTLSRMGQGTVT